MYFVPSRKLKFNSFGLLFIRSVDWCLIARVEDAKTTKLVWNVLLG